MSVPCRSMARSRMVARPIPWAGVVGIEADAVVVDADEQLIGGLA